MAMAHRKPLEPLVLIIEDDDGSREALAELLAREGYGVATAEDGAGAMAYLRSGHRPSVILLDLMMTGVDGWDFRAAQKRDESFAQIPVIAISAAGTLVDVDHSLRKPIEVDALLALLRDVTRAAAV
jgi:CheY-like chemotaxis protein